MNNYWFLKTLPLFFVTYDDGTTAAFNNWKEPVIDVKSRTLQIAKETAALTGIIENFHYDDIIVEMGKIENNCDGFNSFNNRLN